MPTTNWEEIETEYVTTEVSYRDLAERHEISVRQVAKQAKAGGWIQKRQEWRNRSATNVQQKCADEAAEIHTLMYHIWRQLLERYLKSLADVGLPVTPGEVRGWTKMLLAEVMQPQAPILQVLDMRQLPEAELDRLIGDGS